MASMPMRFAGLVLENTNRCNARCGMCYQSSGPKGSDVLGKAHLPLPVMLKAIEEAIRIPTLTPRFHLAGGEAFMHMEECIALFQTAQRTGYVDITGTTNAFWARTNHAAQKVTGRLRDVGVTSLEISWDFWHLPYIAGESIGKAIKACFESGIEVNLRILTTKSHNLQEALDALPADTLELVSRITSSPVFATGRAAQHIDPSDIHPSRGGLDSACHSTLNLTVNSLGEVFPCCAGFDQTNNYLFGNIHTESIIEIANRINTDPIARVVVFRGVAALLPVLEKAGVAPKGDFKGICELCWTIFSSPDCVQALKDHRDAATLRAIDRLTGQLAEAIHV